MSQLSSRFTRISVLISLSAGLICSFMPLQLASALSGSDWKAGQIIDDSILYNGNDMTVNQVQAFMNSKVPTCDTWGTQTSEYGGGTRAQYGAAHGHAAPYICLKDYYENPTTHANNLNGVIPSGSLSSAQIIVNAAQTYGISVRFLLATLQKESAGPLLTDTWPFPGQYTNAMGYGCPDTAACDAQYAGFYNQVMNAARQFSVYHSNPGGYRYKPMQNNTILYNPNSACGTSTVYVQNYATAGLYNYTPYQPDPAALSNIYGSGDTCSAYGNRNVWRYFNDWFGPTTGTSLLQGSSSTVYLVSGTTKYSVPSGEILSNFGMRTTVTTRTSDSYLQGLTDGGTLGDLFTVSGDPTVYLADSGRKYGIPSGTICTAWGLNCSTGVREISYADSNKMQDGGVLQSLLRYGNYIYKMQNGQRLPYLSPQSLINDGGVQDQSSPVASVLNIGTPGTPITENGSLVKFGNNPTIYAYANSHYYAISSGAIFSNWFGNHVVYNDSVSSYASSPPTSSGILPSTVKNSTTNTIYFMSGGKKIDVTSRASQWPTAVQNSDFDTLLANASVLMTDAGSTTYRTPNGAIFNVQNGKKQVIASMADFYALGYTLNNTVNVDYDTMAVLDDGPASIGEGSVFKVEGSTAIYLKGSGQSVYNLQSMNQLGQFQLTRIDPVLPVSQLSQYTAPQALSSFVALDNATSASFVVDSNAKLWNFGTTQAQQWGISSPALTNMSTSGNTYGGLGKATATLPAFALYNGTVYYGSGGVAHPIATYSMYTSLGGNASNTFNATKDFIDSTTLGSVM